MGNFEYKMLQDILNTLSVQLKLINDDFLLVDDLSEVMIFSLEIIQNF